MSWAEVSRVTFTLALFAYLAAMVGYFYFLAYRRDGVVRTATAVAWLGLGAHVVSVVARGVAAGRTPWGNMYEYSSLVALLVVAIYLVLVEGRGKVRAVGGFVLLFSISTMAIATMFLYVGPAPLVPALNSYWLQIHVAAVMAGSALFALSGILTILYLVKERNERRAAEHAAPPIMGGSVDVERDGSDPPPHFADGGDEAAPAPSRTRRGILPSSEVLDRLAYRAVAFGFPIWTFAVIAGAIWAQEAWSRYWGWDPKETWAFITWVVYAGYLHARSTSGWRGRKAAVISLAGFVSLLITYYVVNIWIPGLHSYSGLQ